MGYCQNNIEVLTLHYSVHIHGHFSAPHSFSLSLTHSTAHSLRTHVKCFLFFYVFGCLLQQVEELCLRKKLQTARMETAKKTGQLHQAQTPVALTELK